MNYHRKQNTLTLVIFSNLFGIYGIQNTMLSLNKIEVFDSHFDLMLLAVKNKRTKIRSYELKLFEINFFEK